MSFIEIVYISCTYMCIEKLIFYDNLTYSITCKYLLKPMY